MIAPPTATAITSRLLPRGIPLLRDEALARTGLFASALDTDATPGDPGLFGPGSATWRLMGQPAQALAGLRAALLQTLSAPIPTGTHSTGSFYTDFGGRVARTGAFVQRQNLGSMDEVFRSARAVRAMHRTVKGVGDDGTEFDAGDHHQQAWVSMTLTESIIVMVERFGSGPLRRDVADAFVKEQSTHGALLDPRVDLRALFDDPSARAALAAGEYPLPSIESGELPTTRAELESLMHAWTDELSITELTRGMLDATVELEFVPMPQRAALRLLVLATLSTMPDEWHDLVAPSASRTEEFIAAQAVQIPLAMVQAVFGRSPAVDAAEARAKAGAN